MKVSRGEALCRMVTFAVLFFLISWWVGPIPWEEHTQTLVILLLVVERFSALVTFSIYNQQEKK